MASDAIPDRRCGNSYLAIRTDIYKDGREFIYCDCCGALADRKTWQAAFRPAPKVAGSSDRDFPHTAEPQPTK